jgi:CubicO group peptidase (beta-lactamase class C family)
MFRRRPYLLATVLAIAPALSAQSPDAARIDPIFAAYQHSDTPGCAIGVDAPGHETWTNAYGMADLEHAVKNTPNTVFEAGSVSKQFTAAAVLLLVERGKVSLDDNIRKYFPELPVYQRPITVRELLNHTSGLRDWGDVEDIAGWPRTTRDYTHAHVLDILSRQHALNYPPGDAWSYTNSGYNLAAMLVERVSGMSLQAFMRQEFFEPLGMTSTQWRDDFRRIVPNRAIAYDPAGPTWRQDMPFEDIYGNGGLLTTVGDLLKWNANLASGKLHGPIFEQMQKPSALTSGKAIGYGFGFFLDDFQGLAEVDHSGATAGYRTWLGRIPGKGLSIAILCNAASANPTDYANQILRLYLDLTPPKFPAAPEDSKPGLYRNVRDHGTVQVERDGTTLTFSGRPIHAKIRFEGNRMIVANPVYGEDIWERVEPSIPADPGEFVGVYASEDAETVLRVDGQDGKLVLHRRPNRSFILKPTYADAFDCPLGSIRFVRGADGRVVALEVGTSRVWNLRFDRQPASAPAAGVPNQ